MKTRIRPVALSPIWLLACLLLASCDSYGPSSSPDRPGGSSSWGFGRKAVLEDAERALIDGDMPRAEKSAMEFTNRVDVDRAQLGRGWRVLALAALENRNAFLSLNALERWRQSLNLRQLPEEWLETWNGAMLLLPPAEAARRAEAISAQKTGQPEDLTREARLF
ncbi:MAG: hypothetical protein LBD82_02000, partial [Deltaproteobacteria bacterium]|nr:hypothetical protein [Deltaproteobacteria bacterium]